MISERIIRLSEKVRDTPVTICLDRAKLVTNFYSEPSMEPFILRRAKVFAHVLDNKKIFYRRRFHHCRAPGVQTSRGTTVSRNDSMAAR